jgi:hypothetical protein
MVREQVLLIVCAWHPGIPVDCGDADVMADIQAQMVGVDFGVGGVVLEAGGIRLVLVLGVLLRESLRQCWTWLRRTGYGWRPPRFQRHGRWRL